MKLASAKATLRALATRGLLDLLDEVCARRGVTRYELCGRQRRRAVARARHELWWLIRKHPERYYSFPEIARLFACDHSSVINGVTTHQRRANAG